MENEAMKSKSKERKETRTAYFTAKTSSAKFLRQVRRFCAKPAKEGK